MNIFFKTITTAELLLLGVFPLSKALAEDAPNAAPVIRFATALIEPYQLLDENEELAGLALPMISCVMKDLDTKFTVDLLPWARAQKNVELGYHDVFFVASKNAVRDTYAQASEPMFSGSRSWVFRSGFDGDADSEAFKKEGRVGSIFGTNMHSWLEQNYTHVVAKPDGQSLIELLDAGRVDALLVTDAMHEHMMRANGFDKDRFHCSQHSTNPLGAYFGNKFLAEYPEMLDRFNRALGKCRGQL